MQVKPRTIVHFLLALFAIALCWAAVGWAFRPGLFPIHDELNNPARLLTGYYDHYFHLLPSAFYADRPIGWTFIALLFRLFGFHYAPQVACMLAIHFANCGLAFLLFRRLDVRMPIAIAGVALFGGLASTAQTVTYIGACFDVICLFFLLASMLAILSQWRGSDVLSAFLFLAALRTKEFSIITPVLLTLLLYMRLPQMRLRPALLLLTRRLWMHYAILLVFSARYIYLFSTSRAAFPPDNLYFIDLRAATWLQSLSYYTSLIFSAEESHWRLPPLLLIALLGAILIWALLRRRAGIAFGICSVVLLLQPICLTPNTRTPFYVYAPQLFLIAALCLLAEEALAKLWKRDNSRWVAAVVLALAVMTFCVALRRRPYFRDRVNWNLNVRRASMRSAEDATILLPAMPPGTHVYVNHARDIIPVLFVAGPCSYLQLVSRQRGITCIVDQPTAQLNASYTADFGPKFLLDYHDDGSVTVLSSKR